VSSRAGERAGERAEARVPRLRCRIDLLPVQLQRPLLAAQQALTLNSGMICARDRRDLRAER
jgi:hypothetical protein